MLCVLHTHVKVSSLQGTVNLVEACKQAGIKRFVLVTSLGTDDGLLSPLGPVLFWKKRAEVSMSATCIHLST